MGCRVTADHTTCHGGRAAVGAGRATLELAHLGRFQRDGTAGALPVAAQARVAATLTQYHVVASWGAKGKFRTGGWDHYQPVAVRRGPDQQRPDAGRGRAGPRPGRAVRRDRLGLGIQRTGPAGRRHHDQPERAGPGGRADRDHPGRSRVVQPGAAARRHGVGLGRQPSTASWAAGPSPITRPRRPGRSGRPARSWRPWPGPVRRQSGR